MKMPSDLMIEHLEMAKASGLPKGIRTQITELAHCTLTEVRVEDQKSAIALGREIGRYLTLETQKTYEIGEPAFEEIADILSKTLKTMLGDKKKILCLGLGNPAITPDSLGEKAIRRLMITRPLEDRPKDFSSICGIASPVYGISGIESAEMAQGLVKAIRPEAVILIDAMATGNLERLCKTIQLSDAGLVPGGGVDNARKEISFATLGVPVFSIGMPTVVDCRALLAYVLEEEWEKYGVKLHPYEENLLATPRQMELATDMGAKIIAFSLNKSFHGDLSTEEILKYLY